MLRSRINVVSVFFVAGVLAIISVGCSGSSNSTPVSPTPAPTPSPTPTPPPTPTSNVSIVMGASSKGSNAYNPNPTTVATGTKVTWTNNDSIVHTSTSNGSGWDSGIMAPGASFSFTFQTAGTFTYKCTIHPGMMGTIMVQ